MCMKQEKRNWSGHEDKNNTDNRSSRLPRKQPGKKPCRNIQNDVIEIASANPHIITIPYKILDQMPYHETTVKTLKEFEQAWTEFKAAEKTIVTV